jgi:hypothetical protein
MQYCIVAVTAKNAILHLSKYRLHTPDWRGMKEFKALGMEGLCEIRFKTDNVQYRPTGSFGPGDQTFTIWIGLQQETECLQSAGCV